MRRLLVLGVLAVATLAQAQLGPPSTPSKPSPPKLTLRLTKPRATPTPVLPMATRPAGPFGFQAVAVPTGVVGLQATMDISQASDPLPTISVVLEGSLDGGANWMGAGRFDNPAEPKGPNKQGQLKTVLGAAWAGGPFWSDTTNPNRQLRGAGTLGGTLRFALSVTPL